RLLRFRRDHTVLVASGERRIPPGQPPGALDARPPSAGAPGDGDRPPHAHGFLLDRDLPGRRTGRAERAVPGAGPAVQRDRLRERPVRPAVPERVRSRTAGRRGEASGRTLRRGRLAPQARFADRREPVDLVAEGAGSGSDGVGPALRAVGVGARVARGDGPSGGWRRLRSAVSLTALGIRGCAGLADWVTRGG